METMVKVPLDWPNLGELEKEYVIKAMDSGFVSSAGPMVPEFEDKFASYVGTETAVATVNGTSALHLALLLLGIGPGDEVIVPALTFIATVNPVTYVGAKPVVVDVDPLTWNMDPEKVKKAITGKTRAIIPVHLYGNPADMDALMHLARQHGLNVIEDATEALGATYGGRMLGTLGDIGVYSFNGNKVITTGSGGMLVTNNKKWARRARILVNQGRQPGQKEYDHEEVGFNYRLTNIQAALGLAQLERLPGFLAAKRRNAACYREQLAEVSGLTWQQEITGAESNWWLFSILVDEELGLDMHSLMHHLQDDGIQVRSLFKPIDWQPCYTAHCFRPSPVAGGLYRQGINLPSATFLQTGAVKYVCSSLKEWVKKGAGDLGWQNNP